MENYPDLVCIKCAEASGKALPHTVGTFDEAHCDICKRYTLVTEPHTYGHFTDEQVKQMRQKIRL